MPQQAQVEAVVVDDLKAPEFFTSSIVAVEDEGPNMRLTFVSDRRGAAQRNQIHRTVNLRIVMSREMVVNAVAFLSAHLEKREVEKPSTPQ